MKKLLALLLAMLLCLGVLVACNNDALDESSCESTQKEMLVKEINSNRTLQLSEQDAKAIEKILNEGDWINDITKTIPDYIFYFSDSEIKYASGIFNDWGSNENGDERCLWLSEEETELVNSILKKYFNSAQT